MIIWDNSIQRQVFKNLSGKILSWLYSCEDLWIVLKKGSIFGENDHIHMTNFLHSLSYLICCKYFVDVFTPINAIATSQNIIFFILMATKF